MDLLTREQLNELISRGREKSVSIYMPAHKAGTWRDGEHDALAYKNLLKKAENLLVENGYTPLQAARLMDPAKRIVKNVFFKEHHDRGLALFITEELFDYYWLPVNFRETVVVNRRFYIKPLLELFAADNRFYALSLSQDSLRFFAGSRYGLSPVTLKNAPVSLGDSLKYTELQRQGVRFKGTTKAGVTKAGVTRGTYMLEGHGVGIDDKKDEIFRFFRMVDRGIRNVMETDNAPLVLSGVDYLIPLYRDANTYPYLLPDHLRGNTDGLNTGELHERIWSVVEPHFRKAEADALGKYFQLSGFLNRLTSDDAHEILPASVLGRVDTLFIAKDAPLWGTYNPCTNEVDLHAGEKAGDEDLLDRAAVHTLLHDGKVFLVDTTKMPDAQPVSAIFRY
jgi:hypothetical protein